MIFNSELFYQHPQPPPSNPFPAPTILGFASDWSPEIERKRERERDREIEREREIERKIERERKRERGRDKDTRSTSPTRIETISVFSKARE